MSFEPPKKIIATIPLSTTFRFAHEPLQMVDGEPAFVGRERDLDILAERLLFSEGGSFLITGYRGVGKTSFVNRVVKHMHELLASAKLGLGDAGIIPLPLTLARTLAPVELMHLVIRRLYEELAERQLLAELPADLQSELSIAYQRTSVSLTRKVAQSIEGSFGVSDPAFLLGTLTLSGKKASSRDEQRAFLPYDEKAAEHDLIRIARRLSRGYVPGEKGWIASLLRVLTGTRPAICKLKFIFIFDEIDKLDDAEPGMPATRYLDDLLVSLKNVLTTSGISFVFIAGKDLHDRWLLDLSRGDSIYESVFCYDKYLPCMWDEVADICMRFADARQLTPEQQSIFADFQDYLRFKGRGIPRRIIRTFNEYVRWKDGQPYLHFTRSDIRRFRFYAELQRILSGRDEYLFGSVADEAATDRDRQRLGAYYFIDWVLSRGALTFTVEDGVTASRELSRKIAPAKEAAPDVIGHLVDVLADNEVLERIEPLPAQLVVVEPDRPIAMRYRLTRRRMAELGHFQEDMALQTPSPLVVDPPPGLRFLRPIGSGGMGTVYQAWDDVEGRVVAVKMVEYGGSQGRYAERLRDEGEVLRSLRHRNIVRYLRFIEHGNREYIVMEYVAGRPLSSILAARPRVPLEVAGWIARDIASAVQYIHERGFCRLDLKPANVLIQDDGSVFVADMGIAKRISGPGSETSEGFIGTPLYAAPEQFEGQATPRSDTYSFGVMLFEMLAGRSPYRRLSSDGDPRSWFRDVSAGNVLRLSECADISQEVDSLLALCLSQEPENRPELSVVMSALAPFLIDVSRRDVQDFVRSAVDAVVHDERRERRQTATGRPTPRLESAEVEPTPGGVPFEGTGMSAPPSRDATGFDKSLYPETIPLLPFGVLHVIGPEVLAGQSFKIKSSETRIGRSRENDMALDHFSVSRFHADLLFLDGQFFIQDLNSANGVFIANERVRSGYRVAVSGRFRIGDVTVNLELLPRAA